MRAFEGTCTALRSEIQLQSLDVVARSDLKQPNARAVVLFLDNFYSWLFISKSGVTSWSYYAESDGRELGLFF